MAYVDITESSGLGQGLVRRFPGCTLTPRFARRLTRGPRRTELSGLGKVRTLVAPLRISTPPPPEPIVVTPAPVLMQRRTAFIDPITQVVTTIRPLVGVTRPPTLIQPAITTAIRLAETKIRRDSPVLFRQKGFTPRVIERLRTPSGATYRATDVKVVAGADIVSKSITGAGAPMTGQDISLKEPAPIVTVAPTVQGITFEDETVPTFVEAAAVAPSPFLKYGMLAIGGYILYDSFVKSKPKKKRRRR